MANLLPNNARVYWGAIEAFAAKLVVWQRNQSNSRLISPSDDHYKLRPCAALTRLQDRHREGQAPPLRPDGYASAKIVTRLRVRRRSAISRSQTPHPGMSVSAGEGLAPPAVSHPCYGYAPVGDGVLDVPLSDSHPGTSAPVGEGLAPPDHSALRRHQNHGV